MPRPPEAAVISLESAKVKPAQRGGRFIVLLAASLLLSCGPAGAQQEGPAPPLPVAGEVVQPFSAEALDGTMKTVSFEGRGRTVLLFFLSSCPTCHRMIPEWNRAFQRKPQGLQVVGVLMDREAPGFFQQTQVGFPVVRSPGREFLQKLKVSRVPLMVRVGPGGRIEDVALGYNDPIRVGEIFRP
jgi:hypothetical protein